MGDVEWINVLTNFFNWKPALPGSREMTNPSQPCGIINENAGAAMWLAIRPIYSINFGVLWKFTSSIVIEARSAILAKSIQ